jgi:predicted metal-binding membrane protein
MPVSVNVALLSTAVLGFRHGFDYDHIAAISDIASVQTTPARTMKLGVLYAGGHAATVAALGSAVILFRLSLPHCIDRISEVLVGLTLIVLGAYVLASVLLRRHSHAQSRILLLITAVRWLGWQIRSCFNPPAKKPESFGWDYDPKSVFGVGVIHGLGAETPTQLLFFLLAANLGGTQKGFFGLLFFIGGLLIMNTLMTASAAGLFRLGTVAPKVQRVLAGVTATYSFVIGVLLVMGTASILPELGGG